MKHGYNCEDLTGKVVGYWLVVEKQGATRDGTMYLCRCQCGTTKPISASRLNFGKTNSCGCRLIGPRINLKGRKVGKLKVYNWDKSARAWECQCICGKIIRKETGQLTEALRKKRMSSCGCYTPKGDYKIGTGKHDFTKEYLLWDKAKVRAKRVGVPFNIAVEDVVIPEVCPLLGIKLNKNNRGKWANSSPTLDRKIPNLGYVTGNVWVISYRANLLKNDATTEELELLTRKLREYEIS